MVARHLKYIENCMENLFEMESVRHYISLLQENITRMASNCANCKTWLITIVSALFALLLTNDSFKDCLWIAFIPTVLFMVLDAYYLGLEKRFRDIEEAFVENVKIGADVMSKLYVFKSEEDNKWKYFFRGLRSLSTWAMYATVAFIILLINVVL